MADLGLVNPTDLDFLTELMRRKQRLYAATRAIDEAKAEKKSAQNALDALMDQLEPHVQARRDENQLPKFPGFGQNDNSGDK